MVVLGTVDFHDIRLQKNLCLTRFVLYIHFSTPRSDRLRQCFCCHFYLRSFIRQTKLLAAYVSKGK